MVMGSWGGFCGELMSGKAHPAFVLSMGRLQGQHVRRAGEQKTARLTVLVHCQLNGGEQVRSLLDFVEDDGPGEIADETRRGTRSEGERGEVIEGKVLGSRPGDQGLGQGVLAGPGALKVQGSGFKVQRFKVQAFKGLPSSPFKGCDRVQLCCLCCLLLGVLIPPRVESVRVPKVRRVARCDNQTMANGHCINQTIPKGLRLAFHCH